MNVLPKCAVLCCTALIYSCTHVVAGVVHGTSWELEKVRGNGVMAMLTLAIISVVAALQVFGKDRLVFWRESESGMPLPCASGLQVLVLRVQGFLLCCSRYSTAKVQCLADSHKHGLFPHSLACPCICLIKRGVVGEGRGGGGGGGQVPLVVLHCLHVLLELAPNPAVLLEFLLPLQESSCGLLLQGCTRQPSFSGMLLCT